MYSNYNGRIIQLIEALDYGDAVSNQAIRLHQMLNRDFGIRSEIYSKYAHEKMTSFSKPIKNISVDEKDIIVFHFSGFAKFTGEILERPYCTKVMVYHNITPEHFFKKGTTIYNHCKQGRKQLEKILPLFHFFVGDSQFNLQDLSRLGVDSTRTTVLPIFIPNVEQACQTDKSKELKKWIFVGRIAPNKRQDLIVQKFHDYQTIYGGNHKLYLVGNFDKDDWYYNKLCSLVNKLKIKDNIFLTGKVSDEELTYYYQEADIFLSLSEHEGFGVPLIEACHYQVPVVALDGTAVSETLEGSPGLEKNLGDIPKMINRVFFDESFREEIIEQQNKIKERYGNNAIKNALATLLKHLLPDPCQYKTVSIVICTYNRDFLLERCLDYLSYQTNPNFEVIVVNGPSDDKTDEVLEKYKGKIKLAKTNLRNLSVSRNLGIELASADIVALIDDDALPYDDWVDRLLHAYNSLPLNIAGVGGPAFYAGSLEFQMQDHAVNSSEDVEFGINKSNIEGKAWFRHLIGTNCSFKKEVLYKIGGFDEQYDYFLDETDLCFRLQKEERYLIHYNKKLFLRHEFAQSHNRKSAFNYNWRTICKNTAYFILKANRDKRKSKNIKTIKNKLNRERILFFKEAESKGLITNADKERYISEVYKGMEQGISDDRTPRRLRVLKNKSERFVQFGIDHSYPIVRKTIKPLHIVLLSKEFPPFRPGGGIGTLYYNLANELLQMGHWVSVVIPEEKESEYNRGRFSLYRVKQRQYFDENEYDAPGFTQNLNWACTAAEFILELNKDKKVDLVDSAIWDFEAFALPIMDMKREIPLVLRLVTPFKVAAKLNGWEMSAIEKALFEKAERDLIANADAVIPISKSIAKTIE
ncbi:MAG: glycosyltransferase, partial [Desulfobacteraceae bacterium]|nr:glycosyltransferase [Desulfobacteraceae bacterium]